MKTRPIAILIITGLVFSLRAAEQPGATPEDDGQPVTSRVTDVVVYADRAQVTRAASVTLSADASRYAFAKLPGWVDEGSVRVSVAPADAGQVLDVQVRRTYLARASDEDFQKAETAVREIADQIAALDDEKAVLDAEARQVEGIRAFSVEKLPKDVATREVKADEYAQSIKFVAASLRETAVARRELEKKRRDLQPELNACQRKLDELRQRAQLEQRTVVVTAKGASKPATLSLTYMLPGATWEPVHELRAIADGGSVGLSSLAVVMQTSGEDWSDVALSLSTQRSTETMRIPELEALLVSGRRLPQLVATGRESFVAANQNWTAQNGLWFDFNNRDIGLQREFRDNQMRQLSNVKRVEQVFETLQQRGTTAHFPALARQTVRADGRPVRVQIGRADLAAQHRILAAPELSLNAARLVDLTNSTGQALLPGRVALFLGGAFLGQTDTEFVAPGEDFPLYLGVADQIKLARTLDKKRSALTRGGTKTRMQLSFLVSVANLGDQPAVVQLTDRVPVSESDEVRISGVKITPEGKPDAKGLLQWDLKLAAKQSKEFRIEYTMEYPADLPTRAEAASPAAGRGGAAGAAGSMQFNRIVPQAPLIQSLERQLK